MKNTSRAAQVALRVFTKTSDSDMPFLKNGADLPPWVKTMNEEVRMAVEYNYSYRCLIMYTMLGAIAYNDATTKKAIDELVEREVDTSITELSSWLHCSPAHRGQYIDQAMKMRTKSAVGLLQAAQSIEIREICDIVLKHVKAAAKTINKEAA